MKTFLSLLLLLAATSTAVLGADPADNEVKNVIEKFQQALERHDVAAIGTLFRRTSWFWRTAIVNDVWADFRDNHLVPEFTEPAEPSRWEFVKVAVSSEVAWGYTKQTINQTWKDGKPVGYFVWSAHVLQKVGSVWKVVLLGWGVRRLGAAD